MDSKNMLQKTKRPQSCKLKVKYTVIPRLTSDPANEFFGLR